MLHDSHQRMLIINRCWLIYDLSGKLQDFVKRASEIIASEGQN